jgi:type IV pilus assembly protein PilN
MRLDINLASHPYEDAGEFWRRWGTGLIVLAVVTVLLSGFTLWGWYRAHNERVAIEKIKQGIGELDGKLARAQAVINKPENRTMRERSDYLNSLFQQKALSWTNVFEELERVMPPGLHVVSIKPEITKENQLELKLVVAGTSRERALELVRKLEESKRFQRTQIEQEGNVAFQGSGDQVQFQISALYAADFPLIGRTVR